LSLRFVHAADLHLDSPFLGLSAAAPAHVREAMLDATFAAYDAIIQLCLDRRVEALLVAGDVYDGADRSLRAQRRFYDGLQQLSDAGIRSFVCHGNHDHLGGWEAQLDPPPLCHRFGATVEAVPFDPADPARGSVYGVSYPRQEVRENLAAAFVREGDARLAIGLLHANVGEVGGHANYSPCTLADLAVPGMDYWALGHVHTRQVMRAAGPAVVYPGNPQGRHPYEGGPRGVYVVELDDSGRAELEFVDVSAVRWERLAIGIERFDREQQLMDAVQERIASALDAAGGRPLVARLEFTGRGAMHATLRRNGFAADLREHVNETWGASRPFAWCERVRIDTAPAIDRDRYLEGQDFLADVLRMVDDVAGDDEQVAALGIRLQPLYAHERVKRYLHDAVPGNDELRTLLREAETLCLEQLATEEA
jgi:DNA repair exonuclease SbcCD nuclease subunit